MSDSPSPGTASDSRRIKWPDAYICAALVLLTIVLAYFLSGGRHIDWKAPLLYAGDSILHLIFIKRLIDGHGYFLNGAAGFPFDSNLYDFPGSDGASLATLWAFGKLTGSAPLALNIYYIIGFPLAALSSYLVLKKLGVSRLWAAVFSLLFALLPFHFLRLAHLYYTWYFAIPVFVWYGVQVCESPAWPLSSHRVKDWLVDFLVLVVSASLGVYYAFFGAIVIGLSGVYGSLRGRRFWSLGHSAVLMSFITVGVVINVAPNLNYFLGHGRSQEVAQRQASESEIYGLKLTQMLLPRPQHRSRTLAAVTQEYSTTFPLVNENAVAALGLIASFGMLLLVYLALTPAISSTRIGRMQRQLGFLVVALILIATVGGFSSIFAQFVTSLIRAWNRASIFIAFMALAGLALGTSETLQRRRLIWSVIIAALVVGIGLWDQTSPTDVGALKSMQAEYHTDQAFVARIEETLAPRSAVYQLPYMTFPESAPIGGLGSYDLGKGYLLSRDLRWSFGVTAGREGDDFYEVLSRQPIAVQVEIATYMGFRGIYIDRRGFADHGQTLETSLQQIISQPPLVQENGNAVFYSLPTFDRGASLSASAEKIRQTFGLELIDGKPVVAPTPPFDIDFTRPIGNQLRSVSGLYGGESWGAWTHGPKVTLRLKAALPKRFTINLKGSAFGPNAGSAATVSVAGVSKTFVPTTSINSFELDFSIAKKTDIIEITVPHPIAPKDLNINADERIIGLGLISLSVVPGKQ